MMTEDELVETLEAGRLPTPFHHADHVRAAWAFLRRMPAAEALGRYSDAIRRGAAAVGQSHKYHTTITWAYVLLIAERMATAPAGQSWNEFAGVNRDVLDWANPILHRYYRRETLGTDLSRRVFVMPDSPPLG